MNSSKTHSIQTALELLADTLKREILPRRAPLDIAVASDPDDTPFGPHRNLTFTPIALGDAWGRNWETAWFRLRGAIPREWAGHTYCVRLDIGGEGLVYDDTGVMMQAISSGSVFDSDFSRDIVRFPQTLPAAGEFALWVAASACGLFGMVTQPDPPANASDRYGRFESRLQAAEICILDEDVWGLWLDIEAIRSRLRETNPDDPVFADLVETAERVVAARAQSESISHCRELCDAVLGVDAPAPTLHVTAVGHAHIDTAWLWPITETVRKCARTFATQLALIDRYPDYVFGASQAQHYAFMKERYPELYERIRDAVKGGRWEIQGGMWVEADCNLTDGESLVRQILHGTNFFRNEFGVDVDNLWLPDVFGYSAALPQILRQSGIDCFMTQKLSWNQYNRFPYHAFVWEGIDGSRIFAHFPPEDTYNSTLKPESLIRGARQYAEQEQFAEFLSLFGVGDGGGGPKEEHIEMGLRQSATRGAPQVRLAPAADFFSRLRECDDLPLWAGELYLELHRGTLTTQARTKRLNRRCEQMLRATEKLCCCLPLEHYPRESLDRLWKTVLKNQFHDILPGSSITSVYVTTETELSGVLKELSGLQRAALELLGDADEAACTVFNPTSYRYEETLPLPVGWSGVKLAGDRQVSGSVQLTNETCYINVTIPPHGTIVFQRDDQAPQHSQPGSLTLENDRIRYVFSEDARLLHAYDKETDRVIIPVDRAGNILTLYEDRPRNWDAWDIDIEYEDAALEIQKAAGPYAALTGPVRSTITFHLSIGDSSITQQVTLGTKSKRLDFASTVDWRESHKMLRVAFPVAVRAQEARFDIQYGYVARPTHRNTSWDRARFEVVGQRYADLSEPDYGVALLNDCKYGYKVLGQTIDLNLLRAPTYPDPDADRGAQSFTYSLLPHAGDLTRSDVMREAALLNCPPLVFSGRATPRLNVPLSVSGDGLSLEVIKAAENEDCLVARIVETHGCHTRGALTVAPGFARIALCDLREREIGDPIAATGPVAVALRPFEIRTYKLLRTG